MSSKAVRLSEQTDIAKLLDQAGETSGLEWTVASPPPHENFAEIPVITEEAYTFHPEKCEETSG